MSRHTLSSWQAQAAFSAVLVTVIGLLHRPSPLWFWVGIVLGALAGALSYLIARQARGYPEGIKKVLLLGISFGMQIVTLGMIVRTFEGDGLRASDLAFWLLVSLVMGWVMQSVLARQTQQ